MKFYFIIILFCVIGCTEKAPKNQIDSKTIDLLTDELSYYGPQSLMHFIQGNPKMGKKLDEKFNFKELSSKYRSIQKRLKSKSQYSPDLKMEIASFHSEITKYILGGKFPPKIIVETFESINLLAAIESMKDTSSYDIVRLKVALEFHYATSYINSTFTYHPTFNCDNPSIFSTDTINNKEPVTFFFGHIYTSPDFNVYINKINDREASISFTLYSKQGLTSILIKQLEPGMNTISGYLTAPSPNPRYRELPFERKIYVD
jgi:hypothetical protein